MIKKKCFRVKNLLLVITLVCSGVSVSAQEKLSLTLDKAIEIALSENPTIKVAGQEIALKKESMKEAYAGLFPEASIAGSYSRVIEKQTMAMKFGGSAMKIKVGTANSYNAGLQLALPVYAPALYKAINLSETDVNLAVEKSRASKLDMINEVTKAYYQLLLAQDSYEVLKKSFAQSEANFAVVNAKYEQGRVSEYDKIRAEVQVRSLKPSVVSAGNGVNLALLQLKVLMGVSASLEIEVEGNLKDYEQEMYVAALSNDPVSIENNSALKQLDLNKKMLENTLSLTRTNFLPTLAASFNYSYSSLNDDYNIAHYEWFPYSSVGLNLSIPLFKASNYTKIKKVKIQMNQLVENRNYTEKQLKMQATSYMNNMQASAEQIESNKENVKQAVKGREIAQKRYEVGAGTILELNDSEVSLTQAELTYNQSIYDYLTSKADLDKLIGKDIESKK
ncbi:MAG: TolC family protein [Bacteroidales bacterium]|nr:TolC family protein [Bacteroidales bacterium]